MRLFQNNKNGSRTTPDLIARGAFLVFVLLLIITASIEGGRYFFDVRAEEFKGMRGALSSPEDVAREAELEALQGKMSDLSFLLQGYTLSEPSFRALEDTVHPRVQVLNVSLVSEERTMTVEGIAVTFEALGQQLQIWRDRGDLIAEASIVRVGFEEGRVSFRAELRFVPELFSL